MTPDASQVVRPPQYGNLQRLGAAEGAAGSAAASAAVLAKGPGIDRFTSRQLAREQIRYVHATGQPAHDEFKVSSVPHPFKGVGAQSASN